MSDTEELRYWHAVRDGWKWTEFSNGKWYFVRGAIATHDEWPHPFPQTRDGANSALPPDWTWRRYGGEGWRAFTTSGELLQANAPDTGDEIHDRYLLAKLAWEQEAIE